MGKAQTIALVLAALLALGAKRSEEDVAFQIAEAALLRIEQQNRVDVIVVTPNLSRDARRAAARLRKTVDVDSVPLFDGNSLPPHYVIFHSFAHTSDDAQLGTSLGPIPQTVPGTVSLSCGTGYNFHFRKDHAGQWREDALLISEC